ncbi:hypothetical protein N7468_004184 [Penicillium chermesinum]|uniref:RING-type domain-containing protein n=1 Tax=Penicillium chermesinum TaxID=63820 RepID=A0A9W9P8B2_9EURO|nr:uncharacterized protein N7468_004184 [Penicillium chermesinum]KAJ5239565.1 hypothetical protein N7468_004184 [Penicillium chermesinum]
MPAENIAWLDVGLQEDSRAAVRDYGRLRELISQLPTPQKQYPSICVFLGGRFKQTVMQSMFPMNNIKRHSSKVAIKLRADISTTTSQNPMLFAEGDDFGLLQCINPLIFKPGQGQITSWSCDPPSKIHLVLWSLLIFLFTDVICLCLGERSEVDAAIQFLIECADIRNTLPSIIQPRVILILQSPATETTSWRSQVDERLCRAQCVRLGDSFSSITTMCFRSNDLWLQGRLKSTITTEIAIVRGVRQSKGSLLNGPHLESTFQLALGHVLSSITSPFDLVQATRISRPVSANITEHMVHYVDVGKYAGLTPHDLAPSMASALFMDHYVPGTVGFEPRHVFRSLYEASIKDACNMHCSPGLEIEIEDKFMSLFDRFEGGTSSITLRAEQLNSQKQILRHIHSNRICLVCLLGVAQHVLSCGHALCDRCVQVFGTPTAGYDYRFTIGSCLYCCYQRPLIVDIMGPTMSPSILAIDGGGVRGVIPLEFLLLVQEHLNPCTIQDVIDLGIGTSSGGLIIQGLFIMSWTVPECSRTFESLAHRIFSQRRNSAALNLIRPFITGRSLVSESARWLSWLLRDSCYDARVFDDVLKETFGEYRRMFGPSRDDPREQSYSSTKAGVVATGISRDTSTFVFANFNPTNLQGIGSFQDGGLKHNFAGAIALEVSHQIWPNAGGSVRMLSLGTGITELSVNQTPHFRNVFRDSFLRRGFDAWMSTMDTEQDWRKYKSRLSRQGAFDTIRLNVPLGDTPNGIDAVARIEEYRGLVIAQPGSARMAREAATMLLVSRFYFIICGLPEDTTAPFWCCGMIRCKGPAQSIIEALEHLYPDGTRWMSDYGLLENFQGQSGICPSCGGYSQEIRILARHEDHEINIFLETGSKKRWRASGFPATVASFVDKQGFHSRFGRDDHGKPGWASCKMCDVSRMQTKRKCAIVAPNAETPKRARRPERK